MQAIQAGNEIAAQQVRQAVDEAFRENFYSAPVKNTNRDKGY